MSALIDNVLEVPHRKSVPLWVRISGWGVLLYLVLWGATYYTCLIQIREVREMMISAEGTELPKDFEPSVRPPAMSSSDERMFFFVGNPRCPCPLIIRYDFASYTSEDGGSTRITGVAFLGWRGRTNRQRYWSYYTPYSR
jgi:hypothetical protein